MTKIAIVGATGPTGIHLVAELCRHTADVRVYKAETQTYCQIAELSDQLDETAETGKADELSRKITVSAGTLAALVRDLQDTDIDPKAQDAQEIGSTLTTLDKLCEELETRLL